jgi:hypothetical protein
MYVERAVDTCSAVLFPGYKLQHFQEKGRTAEAFWSLNGDLVSEFQEQHRGYGACSSQFS